MAMTAAQKLERVDAAIDAILSGGQSYKIGSRQLTRADLSKLYEMQQDLQAQVNAGTPGLLDDCYVAMFDGR
jgi:hypothetical protein